MKYTLSLIVALGISVNCLAGSVTSQVDFVQVNYKTPYPNIVAIKPVTMPSDRPGCATDTYGRFGVSLETEAGKAVYSLALAAYASGKNLQIIGTNNCIGGALEEIDYVRIIN